MGRVPRGGSGQFGTQKWEAVCVEAGVRMGRVPARQSCRPLRGGPGGGGGQSAFASTRGWGDGVRAAARRSTESGVRGAVVRALHDVRAR
eukprot:2929077-Prymnesium_polylepis.1